LIIGGVIYKESGSQPGARRAPVLAALVSRGAHWSDSYNHFIVTVAMPTTASASSWPGHSADLDGAKGDGTATSPVATSQATASPAAASQAATSQASAQQGQPGVPWQAVPPNPADPIVLRAGEPASLLPALLAHYPKGTRLERDSEGNIRAVLPPGAKPPAGAAASGKEPGAGGPAGRPAAKLPTGWEPNSKTVVASLKAVRGVHAASPVWGDKYEITTTLDKAQVAALPGVGGVVPDNLLSFSSLPQTNDPDISQEYYLANDGQDIQGQVGSPGASADFSYAWARSRGSGVVIADIDTGVDLANPDLAGQILSTSMNFSVSPPSSDVQAVGTAPGFYHATTVDGVIAALAGSGVGGAGGAPEAKVLALKCSDGDSLSDACIYAAGEYAISQGARVINMSFAEQVSSVDADPTLASLVQAAQSAHVLVTASAGNWGSDNDSSVVLPAGYASSDDNVISVGATDNQDNLASYSDHGATTVDLMAPGTNDFTAYPAYTGSTNAYASGTSYSAPLVAATAALLWSIDPSLTYSQVKADILSSVQAVPALSGECLSGGRLDAQAAVALVQEPVQWSFTGFDQVQPGQPAQVSVAASARAGALPSSTALGYHLELIYDYSGSMYDVAQEQLDWSQGGGQQSVQTGDDGTVFIAPIGTDSANYGTPLDLSVPSPGLTSGSYALVAYAATTSAPGTPLGNPQAVFFDVGQPLGPPVTTATTAGGTTTSAPAIVGEGPGPTVVQGTTTTTAPAATTTTGAGATTTSAPATTTTTAAGTTTTTGATTTTAAGTTTTTAPAATTTTAAGTTTTTASACDAPFSLASVVPNELPADGGEVSLFGSGFPANPVVDAGSVGQPVNSASTTDIEIWVGPMSAGTYDVTVYNATQTQCAELPQALTIDPASDGTTTTQAGGATTSTTSQATTTTAGSSTTVATTTTSTGAGGTTTTTGGGTTTSTSAGATTTTAPGGGGATTSSTSGTGATTTTSHATTTTSPGMVIGPGGMLLAPLSSNNALNGVSVGEWGAFDAAQLTGGNPGSAVDGVDVS
jgi:subtilisin family serine protease